MFAGWAWTPLLCASMCTTVAVMRKITASERIATGKSASTRFHSVRAHLTPFGPGYQSRTGHLRHPGTVLVCEMSSSLGEGCSKECAQCLTESWAHSSFIANANFPASDRDHRVVRDGGDVSAGRSQEVDSAEAFGWHPAGYDESALKILYSSSGYSDVRFCHGRVTNMRSK